MNAKIVVSFFLMLTFFLGINLQAAGRASTPDPRKGLIREGSTSDLTKMLRVPTGLAKTRSTILRIHYSIVGIEAPQSFDLSLDFGRIVTAEEFGTLIVDRVIAPITGSLDLATCEVHLGDGTQKTDAATTFIESSKKINKFAEVIELELENAFPATTDINEYKLVVKGLIEESGADIKVS